jgi:TfoX/Sxy family transcriptional regulator of competence genes
MAAKRKMPTFSKPPATVVAAFETAVAPLPGIERRTMFGYPSAFHGGNMFACVFQDRMMFRLSPEDRAEALALAGAKLFAPMPGRPMKEYVDLPRGVLSDAPALASWARRAHAYARTLPAKARGKRAATTTKRKSS